MRGCKGEIKYPECGSENVIKDGKQWEKQTYLCKKCNRRFTPEAKHIFRFKHFKEQAISKLFLRLKFMKQMGMWFTSNGFQRKDT
ncbi:IS1/IS1595 family N-terminal zinc-binding domain-containing protein [Aquifex sp.]